MEEQQPYGQKQEAYQGPGASSQQSPLPGAKKFNGLEKLTQAAKALDAVDNLVAQTPLARDFHQSSAQ